MATIRVNNLTSADVFIKDVGVVIPASGNDSFSDAGLIRWLIMSANLRALLTDGTLSMDDGGAVPKPLAIIDLYDYWFEAGFDRLSTNPPSATFLKSPDGRTWKIEVDNAGVISTTPVVP